MYACRARCLLSLMLLVVAYGCADSAANSAGSPLPAGPAALAANNVTGVWQGSSIADCPIITLSSSGRCLAMQRITLTMFQDGQRVTGSYKCAFGNENCRDMAETGVIRDGHMKRRLLRIRVMLEDGSMCGFTGMPQNDILKGRYECHWGGPREQGVFRVERSY